MPRILIKSHIQAFRMIYFIGMIISCSVCHSRNGVFKMIRIDNLNEDPIWSILFHLKKTAEGAYLPTITTIFFRISFSSAERACSCIDVKDQDNLRLIEENDQVVNVSIDPTLTGNTDLSPDQLWFHCVAVKNQGLLKLGKKGADQSQHFQKTLIPTMVLVCAWFKIFEQIITSKKFWSPLATPVHSSLMRLIDRWIA